MIVVNIHVLLYAANSPEVLTSEARQKQLGEKLLTMTEGEGLN